ncbi:TadG family pilus assembly protein [Methylobacterium sp. Leaf118]|uniref:TadG family pilus assembly protein n=1 Tax=Methylobacterium sp. Leaf118 TaxID=2876562 RepID=UPI001E38DF9D|nr:TadG family pilus assembly protein [Methylobacterium sp. Leaf118]
MRFASDQRGSVIVMAALSFSTMLGVAAIGLDLGMLYHAKRKAQGAVDLAALSAASDLKQAEAAARQVLADNRYSVAGAISVQLGAYTRPNADSPAGRFLSGGPSPNAVQVTLKTSYPTIFARAIGWSSTYDVGVSSTAATTRFGAFSLGSGVASLHAGIANALLGSMLGTNLSLSVLDYDALLSTHVDAFRVLDALGTKLDLQAATYNDLVASSARTSQVLSALASTAPAGTASDALRRLASATLGDARRFPIGPLIDLGDAAALTLSRGSTGPAVELMAMVSALASVANGDHIVSADLGAAISGLANVRVSVRAGQRRQSSGWVAAGSPRATLRGAQTRVLLEAQVRAPLNLGSLSLPIYAEVGSAQASLRSVSCSAGASRQRAMELDVQPGLFSLDLANVMAGDLRAVGAPAGLSQAADLLTLQLPPLSVRAKANLRVGSTRTQTFAFTETDITRFTPRTVVSTDMVGSSIASLLSHTDLELNGTSLVPLTTLRPLLAATLSAAAAPLDLVLDATLRALGIRVGSATVMPEGSRCEQAVLVQ